MPKDSPHQKKNAPAATPVEKVNRLTLAFAKAVANNQADKDDNLVVSPYNALTAMAMVAKGSKGHTKEELAKSLFGGKAKDLDKDITSLVDLNADILKENKTQVKLKTANGVWTNNDAMELNKKFAADLKKLFDAEISGEDFSSPAVPKKINKWAADNTNNLITEVIKQLSPDDYAVIASALYFKGMWTHKFDKKDTKDSAFTADGGKASTTPTMKKRFKEGQVRYHDGSDYEAIALTYGKEDRKEGATPTMRLLLVRPKDDSTSARDWLAAQAGKATPEWLDAAQFERVSGNVELPRMDIKQKHDLVPVLKELGVKDAFSAGAADFSPMNEKGAKGLFISGVSHDVVFKTDEEGSEAAAVTTVVMRTLSMRPPVKTIDIKLDRSFVFALQDIKTGTALFVGAVNKPNNDMKPLKTKTPKLH